MTSISPLCKKFLMGPSWDEPYTPSWVSRSQSKHDWAKTKAIWAETLSILSQSSVTLDLQGHRVLRLPDGSEYDSRSLGVLHTFGGYIGRPDINRFITKGNEKSSLPTIELEYLFLALYYQITSALLPVAPQKVPKTAPMSSIQKIKRLVLRLLSCLFPYFSRYFSQPRTDISPIQYCTAGALIHLDLRDCREHFLYCFRAWVNDNQKRLIKHGTKIAKPLSFQWPACVIEHVSSIPRIDKRVLKLFA